MGPKNLDRKSRGKLWGTWIEQRSGFPQIIVGSFPSKITNNTHISDMSLDYVNVPPIGKSDIKM